MYILHGEIDAVRRSSTAIMWVFLATNLLCILFCRTLHQVKRITTPLLTTNCSDTLLRTRREHIPEVHHRITTHRGDAHPAGRQGLPGEDL
jgi:hypothetical protein